MRNNLTGTYIRVVLGGVVRGWGFVGRRGMCWGVVRWGWVCRGAVGWTRVSWGMVRRRGVSRGVVGWRGVAVGG